MTTELLGDFPAKVSGRGDDLSTMEYRRREPRFEIDQPVSVKNLEHPDIVVAGRLVNFSASGIRLILERELRLGTMVKVEWGGTILLGEIIYSSPLGPEFAVGLQLEDALYDTEELSFVSDTITQPAGKN